MFVPYAVNLFWSPGDYDIINIILYNAFHPSNIIIAIGGYQRFYRYYKLDFIFDNRILKNIYEYINYLG